MKKKVKLRKVVHVLFELLDSLDGQSRCGSDKTEPLLDAKRDVIKEICLGLDLPTDKIDLDRIRYQLDDR